MNNTTDIFMTSNEDSNIAMILSGTTVGITGIAGLTYVLNFLRKSGVFNLLRSLGIRTPSINTVKTEEEIKAEEAAANTPLGKIASVIDKAKGEQKEMLKVLDYLPLSDQFKQTARNPKSILSKSTQARMDNFQKDLEKGLKDVDIVETQLRSSRSPSPNVRAKLDDESLRVLKEYGNFLRDHLEERIVNRMVSEQETEEVETDVIGQDKIQEDTQVQINESIANPIVIPEVVPEAIPAPVPIKKSRVKKVTQLPQEVRKANIEVDEKDLAEIKLILATKKKQYNVL